MKTTHPAHTLYSRRLFSALALALCVASAITGSTTALAQLAATRTWVGLASKNEFGAGANWSPNVSPGTREAVVFSGSGPGTARWGANEAVQLTASGVGGQAGLFSISLTASQTTSVIFTNTTATSVSNPTFRFYAGQNGTINVNAPQTVVALERGSGSLIIDGYNGEARNLNIVMGSWDGQGQGDNSWQRFVNNNDPGGGAIVFGHHTIFTLGGGAPRNVIFDGTGDIVINGRYFVDKSRMLKKGTGSLTLGGDPIDKKNVTGLSNISTMFGGVVLEKGTLNINNDGALGGSWSNGNKTGYLAISEGTILDNTSGTAVLQKQNQRIFILGDFTFKGTNDLTLCAAKFHPNGPGTTFTWQRVDLYGSHRNITVEAGRFGLGGDIKSGTNTSITTFPTTVPDAGNADPTNTTITKLGAGTLALYGDSQNSYTGTINVSAGVLLVDGNMKASPIVVASGASFGGYGTTGTITLAASSTLKPGDIPLIISDTSVWTWTRDAQDVIVSGTFSGTIGGNYNTLKVDKSVSPTGPNLTLGANAAVEFAIGHNHTNTRVLISDYSGTHRGAFTSPAVAFNNNTVRIVDLANGAATPGTYMLFITGSANLWVQTGTGLVNSGTMVPVTDFDTAFTGLTVDANNTITAGLTVDASSMPPYVSPNYGYLLKKTTAGIAFQLFAPPVVTCDSESIAAPTWAYYSNIAIEGGADTITAAGLPSGLALDLNPNTTYIPGWEIFTISGTPTAPAGTYPVTITVTNPAGAVIKTMNITVKPTGAVPTPVFTSDHILLVRPNTANVKYFISADNLPQDFRVKSVPGNALPAWLELNMATTGDGMLSNKINNTNPLNPVPFPSVSGTTTVILEATNPNGTTEQTLTIIVASSTLAPEILSAPHITWAKDMEPFRYQIIASNSAAYYDVTGALPAGITFNRLTGLFGGMPTAVGSSTVTISAVNTTGTGSLNLGIDVLADMGAPAFTSTNAKLAYLNQGFTYTFTGTPYISEIFVTNTTTLPADMKYDPLTATISGTHTGNGPTWSLSGTTWSIPVRAFNAKGFVDQTFDLTVKQYYPIPKIGNRRRDISYEGRPYSVQITVSTTMGLEYYSAHPLPTGLSLNPATGNISGTPTAGSAGFYDVTLGATTSGGIGTKLFTLNVQPFPTGPFISNPAVGTGVAGQPFNYPITTETPAASYGATGLPRGLSINPATGIISGVPTVGGYYVVTLTTTGPGGAVFETTRVIAIAPANSALVTYAGILGTAGYLNATGTAAKFDQPAGAVINGSGDIYVADFNNNAIRAIATDSMVSSHVVDVPKPSAIAVNSKGDIYFADTQNNSIKQVLASDKTVWIAASGLLGPRGVAVDAADNVYFSDSGRHVIKKISAKTQAITVFAGKLDVEGWDDGKGTAASFNAPAGLVYDRAANALYVADMLNSTLRKIDVATANVTTIAGMADDDDDNLDGVGDIARFRTPEGLAIDKSGFVYIADTGNSTIRVCDPKTGLVSTLIGAPLETAPIDGDGVTARMNQPNGIIVDSSGSGDIFVVDTGNAAIRTLLSAPYIVTPLVSTTIAAGNSLTLDGGAWGAPTPAYTWFKDGVKLTGTSARTLRLGSAKTSDAGTYEVVAASASGTTNSAMQLTVTTSSGTGGSSGGSTGGGGGGGAPSHWFMVALGFLFLLRGYAKRARGKNDNK